MHQCTRCRVHVLEVLSPASQLGRATDESVRPVGVADEHAARDRQRDMIQLKGFEGTKK
jgi:hypothetical protein